MGQMPDPIGERCRFARAIVSINVQRSISYFDLASSSFILHPLLITHYPSLTCPTTRRKITIQDLTPDVNSPVIVF
jgi:hypothetical protein